VARAAAAWIVVRDFGLGLLRKAWINLDLIWAGALMTSFASPMLSNVALCDRIRMSQ
jgi:hypothetical protein